MREKNTQAEAPSEREVLKDLLYAHHARPSCREGALGTIRCRCVACATERASAALATQQAGQGEALTRIERELIEGVLRGAVGFYGMAGTPALSNQAREALEVFRRTTPPAPQQPEALAQQERDREDAERWRWMWNHAHNVSFYYRVNSITTSTVMGLHCGTLQDAVDAAIRAARSSEGGEL